ncbi:MAG: hypothetical protein V1837_05970 [Candidatus Woesearchaeota archaeon]
MDGTIAAGLPVHDIRRLKFGSPAELEHLLRKYPLDESFIDWFNAMGGHIIYFHDWPAGKGSCGAFRHIFLGVRGKGQLVDLAFCHELLHAAVPDLRLGVLGQMFCQKPNEHYAYERVIDGLAEEYACNRNYIGYAKEKIASVLK